MISRYSAVIVTPRGCEWLMKRTAYRSRTLGVVPPARCEHGLRGRRLECAQRQAWHGSQFQAACGSGVSQRQGAGCH